MTVVILLVVLVPVFVLAKFHWSFTFMDMLNSSHTFLLSLGVYIIVIWVDYLLVECMIFALFNLYLIFCALWFMKTFTTISECFCGCRMGNRWEAWRFTMRPSFVLTGWRMVEIENWLKFVFRIQSFASCLFQIYLFIFAMVGWGRVSIDIVLCWVGILNLYMVFIWLTLPLLFSSLYHPSIYFAGCWICGILWRPHITFFSPCS